MRVGKIILCEGLSLSILATIHIPMVQRKCQEIHLVVFTVDGHGSKVLREGGGGSKDDC